ncbi:hypothetical protein [uncultured Caballeronia sp.]|uniref:hypothetical protein n=1 Tax=uncultured Caballeronia sp. TaxID=1827198 RepID=UPI0035C9CAEC
MASRDVKRWVVGGVQKRKNFVDVFTRRPFAENNAGQLPAEIYAVVHDSRLVAGNRRVSDYDAAFTFDPPRRRLD